MKLLSAFVLLLASVEAKKLRVCRPPSEACKATSEEDIQFCQNFIAQNKVCVKPCVAPGPTVTTTLDGVTTTEVVQNPVVTKDTTVTITHTGTPTTPAVITQTATSTTITKTTEVDTLVQTVYTDSTTTQTAWTTSTATKTETVFATTTIPYEFPQDACLAQEQKRNAKEKRAQVPDKCLCFLTSTRSYALATTVTITNGHPTATKTSYIRASTRSTTTRTQTYVTFVDGPVLTAPETTKAVLVTSTQTDRALTTITEQRTNTITRIVTSTTTTTTTSAARATQTSRATNPCDTQEPQFQGMSFVTEQDATQLVSNNDNTRQCCERCFSMSNCFYYSSGSAGCRIWGLIQDTQNCYSDQCPKGLGRLIYADPDGQEYYSGACFDSIVA